MLLPKRAPRVKWTNKKTILEKCREIFVSVIERFHKKCTCPENQTGDFYIIHFYSLSPGGLQTKTGNGENVHEPDSYFKEEFKSVKFFLKKLMNTKVAYKKICRSSVFVLKIISMNTNLYIMICVS